DGIRDKLVTGVQTCALPIYADDWRGIDAGSARGLVVEADIAAHDRDLQRAAGLGQAGDRLLHLPVHLWPVGIGEVQAVGHGQRRSEERRVGKECRFGRWSYG